MNTQELTVIKRIQMMIWVAIGILMMAEIGYLLQATFSYISAIIGAAIIFALHWYNLKQSQSLNWQKIVALVVPLVTILGPVVYLLVQIFSFDQKDLILHLVFILSFIVPLVLLIVVNRMLGRIINNASPKPLDTNTTGSSSGIRAKFSS